MPINSFDVQQRDPRFADQRWLLDLIIELAGPEWDQARLHYYASPCSPDHQAGFLALAATIKKLDDFSRELVRLAQHFEQQGRSHQEVGHDRSAADDYFAAAIAYGAAQWPIYADGELNQALEQKKNECYQAYAQRADHVVRAVEVPYGNTSLPGYLHLPPGVADTDPAHDSADAADNPDDGGDGLPLVVMVSGMDAFKELTVRASADRYLARGMACLVIDGPGQGSCLARGIVYEPDRYGEVGTAAYELAAGLPAVDPDRVMVWGLSQGSFWATQMAAAEPRYAACAVMYTCFDPANTAMFATQSPTFTQKFMMMTGTTSPAELEAVAAAMDVGPLGPQMAMPCLVVAGEDDPLTDPEQTFAHLNRIAGPKELLFYVGEDHAPTSRGSGRLGPPHQVYVADWLADRAARRPVASQKIVVDPLGRLHIEPWGIEQHYTYGLPLTADTVLAG